LIPSKNTGEEMMAEKEAPDTNGTRMPSAKSQPDASGTATGSKGMTGAPKIEGSHTQETVDPAERLPDEPKK